MKKSIIAILVGIVLILAMIAAWFLKIAPPSLLISLFFVVVWLAVAILTIAGMRKVFVKGGQPGWAILIPIYNCYVLLKVAGKPGWWVILMLIPLVNIIIFVVALVGLAQRFGKGGGFVVGLFFLPFIFYPILGFGDAQYMRPPALA
jgi:hypothetical protein